MPPLAWILIITVVFALTIWIGLRRRHQDTHRIHTKVVSADAVSKDGYSTLISVLVKYQMVGHPNNSDDRPRRKLRSVVRRAYEEVASRLTQDAIPGELDYIQTMIEKELRLSLAPLGARIFSATVTYQGPVAAFPAPIEMPRNA